MTDIDKCHDWPVYGGWGVILGVTRCRNCNVVATEEHFRLEAGAGVEPAMNGHEPLALPLGYPADDHSSTK